MHRWGDEYINACVNGCMGEWICAQTDGCVGGQMDRWMEARMCTKMNGQVHGCPGTRMGTCIGKQMYRGMVMHRWMGAWIGHGGSSPSHKNSS